MAALDPGVLGDESAILPLPAPAEQPAGDEAPPSAELALTLELPEDVGDLTGVDYLAHYAMALAHCLAEGGSPPLRLELRASPRATGGEGNLRGLGLRVLAHVDVLCIHPAGKSRLDSGLVVAAGAQRPHVQLAVAQRAVERREQPRAEHRPAVAAD